MTAQAEELAHVVDLADLAELMDLRLYTTAQVRALSGNACSEYWLEQKAREGRIGCRDVGGSRRWSRADIAALWEACFVPPTTESPKRKK